MNCISQTGCLLPLLGPSGLHVGSGGRVECIVLLAPPSLHPSSELHRHPTSLLCRFRQPFFSYPWLRREIGRALREKGFQAGGSPGQGGAEDRGEDR